MDSRSAAPYRRQLIAAAAMLLLAVPGQAQERELGMSVIGNRELPKSLVIVPWKTPGFDQRSGLSLQSLVGQTLQPLDPEVLRLQLRSAAVPGVAGPPQP